MYTHWLCTCLDVSAADASHMCTNCCWRLSVWYCMTQTIVPWPSQYDSSRYCSLLHVKERHATTMSAVHLNSNCYGKAAEATRSQALSAYRLIYCIKFWCLNSFVGTLLYWLQLPNPTSDLHQLSGEILDGPNQSWHTACTTCHSVAHQFQMPGMMPIWLDGTTCTWL